MKRNEPKNIAVKPAPNTNAAFSDTERWKTSLAPFASPPTRLLAAESNTIRLAL